MPLHGKNGHMQWHSKSLPAYTLLQNLKTKLVHLLPSVKSAVKGQLPPCQKRQKRGCYRPVERQLTCIVCDEVFGTQVPLAALVHNDAKSVGRYRYWKTISCTMRTWRVRRVKESTAVIDQDRNSNMGSNEGINQVLHLYDEPADAR